jgi:hypothetical protein
MSVFKKTQIHTPAFHMNRHEAVELIGLHRKPIFLNILLLLDSYTQRNEQRAVQEHTKGTNATK